MTTAPEAPPPALAPVVTPGQRARSRRAAPLSAALMAAVSPCGPDGDRDGITAAHLAALLPRRAGPAPVPPPSAITAAEAGVIAGRAAAYARRVAALCARPGCPLDGAAAARARLLEGIRVATGTPDGSGRLSAAQVQALALVADGLAAREIERSARPPYLLRGHRGDGTPRIGGAA